MYYGSSSVQLEEEESQQRQGMGFLPLLIPLAAALLPMAAQMLGPKDDGKPHGQAAIDAKQAAQVQAAQAASAAAAKKKQQTSLMLVGGIGLGVLVLGGLGFMLLMRRGD